MPNKWNNPQEMEPKIKKYFDETPIDEITLTGLCIALDTNKQTLSDYQKKEDFKHLITMAKVKIENAYELSLRKHGRSGDIFALKNFGWSDRQELEISGSNGSAVKFEFVDPPNADTE